MAKERWTVLRILKWTQSYLAKKNIPNPRLEGELLLSHVLRLDRVGLYLNYDMILAVDELEAFRGVIQRRAAGEPLPYITGYQEFWSIRLKVGPSVLIPRPETEILVEEAIRLIHLESWQEPRLVEVGTGCGAIAISIAKSIPSAKVVATEISWEGLVLARENAIAHDVASRTYFVQGNLLSVVRPGVEAFDLVISNPPYVKRGDINGLQREIRHFEPRIALDGGVEGLDFHRRLLEEAPSCLRTDGWLILEIGGDQGEDVVQLTRQIGGFKKARVIPDFSGRSRALVAQKA